MGHGAQPRGAGPPGDGDAGGAAGPLRQRQRGAPGAEAGYHADYSSQVQVPGIALDSLLAEGPPLDLIRIDIEGSEPQALRGAATAIGRSPALRIISEWSVGMMAARADLGGFIAWLQGMGFRFWLVNAGGGFEPLAASALLALPHSDVLISRQEPG
ncbi:FkbM family methyltransferase [Paeniroseomonas aquatica]|uniref:FkbM family methyltransferase n=1 Tax=Paeniroseomonas aquatica TaxID=373043 RepID=UPI0036099476